MLTRLFDPGRGVHIVVRLVGRAAIDNATAPQLDELVLDNPLTRDNFEGIRSSMDVAEARSGSICFPTTISRRSRRPICWPSTGSGDRRARPAHRHESCSGPTPVPDAGVSEALARERAAAIKVSLRAALRHSCAADGARRWRVTVRFTLAAPHRVVLDFAQPAAKVRAVRNRQASSRRTMSTDI